MYRILMAAVVVIGLAPGAAAQPASRFEVGPVARYDRLDFEGHAEGEAFVGGLAGRVRLSRAFSVEGEITGASGRVERSYEGWFVSYTEAPNPSRQETERMAPVIRRTLRYAPGVGWSAAFAARRDLTPRIGLTARAGFSARRIVEGDAYTVLSIPNGVDPERVARDFEDRSSARMRGGLLLGLGASLALTRHLSVAPELRIVWSGPARIGNTYREVGLGVQCAWRF